MEDKETKKRKYFLAVFSIAIFLSAPLLADAQAPPGTAGRNKRGHIRS